MNRQAREKLPAYGRRLMDFRLAGKHPDHLMVFGQLGWPRGHIPLWTFVVVDDFEPSAIDLRFLAGLCLFFKSPFDLREKALGICKQAAKCAQSVHLLLTDAAGDVVGVEIVKSTGIKRIQVSA